MIGAVAKLRSERSRERRWVSYRDGGFVNVTFAVHAEPKDVLGAYFYALNDASQGVVFLRLSSMISEDELDEEEQRLWEILRELGWNVDRSNLHPGPRRVEWRVDELRRHEE